MTNATPRVTPNAIAMATMAMAIHGVDLRPRSETGCAGAAVSAITAAVPLTGLDIGGTAKGSGARETAGPG